MCITVWVARVSAEKQFQAVEGLDILHCEEAIRYSFENHNVEILCTILVKVRTPDAHLHLVHRKWVEIEDATETVLNPASDFEQVLSEISPARAKSGESDLKNIVWVPPLSPCSTVLEYLNEGSILAQCPGTLEVNTDIGGNLRKTLQERMLTPYTSVSFGPWVPSDIPYLWRARIRITDPTFSHLIRYVNHTGVQYMYGIEGPEIVWKDIEQLDFRGMSQEDLAPFTEMYHLVAEGKHILPTRSYSVLTFDDARDPTGYNRAYAWTERVIVDQVTSASHGRQFRVNGWHSTSPRFVLLRVAFAETMKTVGSTALSE
jgi:hypothetical protein